MCLSEQDKDAEKPLLIEEALWYSHPIETYRNL